MTPESSTSQISPAKKCVSDIKKRFSEKIAIGKYLFLYSNSVFIAIVFLITFILKKKPKIIIIINFLLKKTFRVKKLR